MTRRDRAKLLATMDALLARLDGAKPAPWADHGVVIVVRRQALRPVRASRNGNPTDHRVERLREEWLSR